VTISSTFTMGWLYGTVGPDLGEVYANGHDHTWTLTLYGTTQSHQMFSSGFGVNRLTKLHAGSFDLVFSGPDAAGLNGFVSDHITGGEVSIELRNSYSSWGNQAWLWVEVWSPDVDVVFWAGHDTFGSTTLFPTDGNGFPAVGPEAFSLWSEYSWLGDYRPGNDGAIEGWYSLVTIAGNVSQPEPGLLAIADATVWEVFMGTQHFVARSLRIRYSSRRFTSGGFGMGEA
jgi:hypothetical protein